MKARLLRSGLVCLAALLLAGTVSGQTERFVLGQKLRDCETAWEANRRGDGTKERRERATGHLKQAVTLFFSLRLGEAARSMDEARFALEGDLSPSAERRWAESLYLKPEGRLLDPRLGSLGFTLAQLYKTEGGIPGGAIVRLTLTRDGRVVGRRFEQSVTSLPLSGSLSIAGLDEGDLRLRSEIVAGSRVLSAREETISLVKNLAPRIEALKSAFDQPAGRSTEAETGRSISGLLGSLAAGQTMETNYPAVRLLRETEALAKALKSGRQFYGGTKSGQFWLSLTLADGSVTPVRIEVPPGVAPGKARPLVIAMHGAGGSENLFFDGYGRGMVADLGRQRGWLVIAPRGSAGFTPARAAAIVEALNQLYTIDRSRVFIVGHSMGGSQAAASMQATPKDFAGVAILGGGGQVRADSAIDGMPVYIGVGTEDFALPNARRLREGLEKAGVRRLQMVEYPGIEHLVIVQEALPDVFRFFDSVSGAGR